MGRHGDLGLAVDQQAAQVVYVGAVAAQVDRNRQRHRHHPGVLAGEKEAHEVRIGLRDQGHPGAGAGTQAEQTPGQAARLPAQFRIGQYAL